MKKFFTLLFLLCLSSAHSYQDPQLDHLWNGICDLKHPTLEDYQRIQHYFLNGRRPNLDLYLSQKQNGHAKFCRMFDLKLIGDQGELPLFERHCFGVDEEDKQRCILLYASYNGIYPEKVRRLLLEIEESGYRGHLLLRIGGFPNTPNGGLRIAHIPYAFKVAFLKEAQLLGYTQVLWLDSALHPLTDLSPIFDTIAQEGHFLLTVGSLEDNLPSHHPDAAGFLGIDVAMYSQIPHLAAAAIGLNMADPRSLRLLSDWYRATEAVAPYMTLFPEELSLSIIAWRLGCTPHSWLGNLICAEGDLPELLEQRPLQFVLDDVR